MVVATPPTENYEEFTEKVREYNTKEPFNFTVPPFFVAQPKTYIKVSVASHFELSLQLNIIVFFI